MTKRTHHLETVDGPHPLTKPPGANPRPRHRPPPPPTTQRREDPPNPDKTPDHRDRDARPRTRPLASARPPNPPTRRTPDNPQTGDAPPDHDPRDTPGQKGPPHHPTRNAAQPEAVGADDDGPSRTDDPAPRDTPAQRQGCNGCGPDPATQAPHEAPRNTARRPAKRRQKKRPPDPPRVHAPKIAKRLVRPPRYVPQAGIGLQASLLHANCGYGTIWAATATQSPVFTSPGKWRPTSTPSMAA